MNIFDTPDWEKMFWPTVPLIETFLRGSFVYLSLFALLRFILKRESATLGITDLLVLVLLADAAQNAMAYEYKSITDGILLVSVIVFWSHTLNWLGYKFPFFQKIIKPNKLLLVKNGRMIRRNMQEELITEEELMSEIRTSGVADISEVLEAYIEGNGKISIICKTEKRTNNSPAKKII